MNDKFDFEELKTIIENKLENWDDAKKIFAVVADINLLSNFPKLDLKDIFYNLTTADLHRLCWAITGLETKQFSVTEAMGIISCFLLVIFNKIKEDQDYLGLLKMITVIPEPKTETSKEFQELNIQSS